MALRSSASRSESAVAAFTGMLWTRTFPSRLCLLAWANKCMLAHEGGARARFESCGRLAGYVGGRALRCDPRIVLPSRGLDGRLRVPSKTIDETRPHLVFWLGLP